jgi:inosose dehydratase
MDTSLDRRSFCKTAALGLGALSSAALAAPAARTVKIGHTGITWPGFAPGRTPPPRPPAGGRRQVDPEAIEQVVKDVASLGYHGLELFSWQVEGMEEHGGLGPLLDKYKLPLISAYCDCNLTDPAQRPDQIKQMVRWGNLIKKYGGTVSVVGPNGVRRDSYDFQAAKPHIVATLNEVSQALTDIGITPAMHQHTGTCVETQEQTYAVMEAVDSRYVKFGPDIGQLQKGGVDPVKVVKDFLPLVQHLHLKDFNGGEHFIGYCPLGQGKVDIPAILDMLEGRKIAGMAMVELDGGFKMPMTAGETARVAKEYLQKQGIVFRT